MISTGLVGREISVFGTDAAGKPFSEAAYAVAITEHEITIEGVQRPVQVNLLLGLSYAGQEGLFRVAWVGGEGTPLHGRIGLREINPAKKVLRSMTTTLALDRMAGTTTIVLEAAKDPEPGRDRRQAPRIRCSGDATFHQQGAQEIASGVLKLLSETGCFIETPTTAPALSRLVIKVKVEGLEVETVGEVHGLQPGFGMGIAFREMPEAQKTLLQQWVARHCKP